MDERKNFFESLNPRSALIVGVVTGVLVLCSIGFLVMLGIYFKWGKVSASGNTVKGPAIQNETPVAQNAPPVVTKSNKPKVELFVMAYCPYGVQMEKALIPAWELLKSKADISIKFVSYAMHGQKEVEENTRQYCMQKEQSAKYIPYLKCFTNKQDSATCIKESGVDEGRLNSCVGKSNKQFGILDKFNDQSTWLNGRYPIYPIFQSENDQYGVQGSPTLVINGTQAESGRSPDAVKQAICAGFNNPPSECSQTLSSVSASPGFGIQAGNASDNAACGG